MRKKGIRFILAPIIGFLLIFTIEFLLTVVLSAIFQDAAFLEYVVLIATPLSALCTLGFFTVVPYGIFLVIKSKNAISEQKRPTLSYESVKKDIARWNWGAFFFSWIWGINYRVWISLLVFVPPFTFYIPFYLGAHGNELAWTRNAWESVEQFHRTQRRWAAWGSALFVLAILIGTVMVVVAMLYIAQQQSGVPLLLP